MTAHEHTDEPARGGIDPRTRTAVLGVAIIGATLAVGAFAGWGVHVGISVSIGALIAVANLYGLARIVGALLGARAEGDPGAGLWGILAVVKIVGLFGGVWLLLSSKIVEPLGLVAGWAALPIGTALGTMFGDKGERQNAHRGNQAPPGGPPVP